MKKVSTYTIHGSSVCARLSPERVQVQFTPPDSKDFQSHRQAAVAVLLKAGMPHAALGMPTQTETGFVFEVLEGTPQRGPYEDPQ